MSSPKPASSADLKLFALSSETFLLGENGKISEQICFLCGAGRVIGEQIPAETTSDEFGFGGLKLVMHTNTNTNLDTNVNTNTVGDHLVRSNSQTFHHKLQSGVYKL